MITGNDFLVYINMPIGDGLRSIAELIDIARESGYSDMQDEEISALMEYNSLKAVEAAKIEEEKRYNDERNRILHDDLLKRRDEAKARYEARLGRKVDY